MQPQPGAGLHRQLGTWSCRVCPESTVPLVSHMKDPYSDPLVKGFEADSEPKLYLGMFPPILTVLSRDDSRGYYSPY